VGNGEPISGSEVGRIFYHSFWKRGGGELKKYGLVCVGAMALLLGFSHLVCAQGNSRWERVSILSPGIPRYHLAEGKEPQSPGSNAGEVKETATQEPLALSLQDCIMMALQNNLDIAVEGYNPKMSEEDIRKEKAAFDPLFYTDAYYANYYLPTNNAFYSSVAGRAGQVFTDKHQNWDLNFGWRQALPTGTSYQLSYNNDRFYSLLGREIDQTFYTFNPNYTSELGLTLSQALLKDFGIDVNKTRIYIAQNNKDISLQQFRDRVFSVIAEVQNFYWNLAAAVVNLEVNRRSLKLAQDLLEINKAKVRAGTLAPLEIVQAEAEVASREENVIVAENLIKQIEDVLRRVMNLTSESQMWERPIRTTDKPSFVPQQLSVDESLKRALELRPDYAQAQIDLANRDIYKRYTHNQLLPSLNLQGSAGLNGIGSSYHDNSRVLRGGDYYSYSVGLILEVPIGNRYARAEYTKASLDQEKSKTSLANLEQKITVEIREVVRQIQTNAKRIETTEKARLLSQKKLEVEEKKLNVGMSTNFEVLRTQRDLLEAETNWLKALLDYQRSLVSLERVEGTILEKHNIELKQN
jgi:outer membrane protein